ncbi:MAG TPA: outer membrane beta-barrel protein [Pirellulaceae bacterium]|nr:outer membrane beta-barrel protein [Pirellulaceae bacterium]HMO92617.1 outer membrane beta-barrel protein [Pirellulaceae bacterium]HMP70690.1 outer membrane beta-barrel protein [Pirellulaceae bacterium]
MLKNLIAITIVMTTASVAMAQHAGYYPQTSRSTISDRQDVPVITAAAAGRRTLDEPVADQAQHQAANHHPHVGENYFGHNGCGHSCDSCYSCDTGCACRYARFFGGWNLADDMGATLGTAQLPGEVSFNEGWLLGTALGVQFGRNWRREIEFTYRHNSGDQTLFGGQAIGPVDGSIQAYSLMGNLVYEMNNLNLGALRPYVGGGIGIVFVNANLNTIMGPLAINDTTGGFQGFTGVERQISSNARAFAEYRYFLTSRISGTDDNYAAHGIIFGLHFSR